MGKKVAEAQELHVFVAVAKKAVVADFHEPVRQDVHEKTPDELGGWKRHDLPLVAVLVVAPLERNKTIFNIKDAVVGDMCLIFPQS